MRVFNGGRCAMKNWFSLCEPINYPISWNKRTLNVFMNALFSYFLYLLFHRPKANISSSYILHCITDILAKTPTPKPIIPPIMLQNDLIFVINFQIFFLLCYQLSASTTIILWIWYHISFLVPSVALSMKRKGKRRRNR